MSDAAAIVVMAVIFAFGVVVTGLLLVTVVPGTLLAESTVRELLRKRRQAKTEPPGNQA